MDEFKVNIKDKEFEFRVKKMNGIQALSFRNFISKMNDSIEDSNEVYNAILSNIEVKVGSDWLSCKQGNDFIPEGLVDSPAAIIEVATYFMEYLKSFF